MTKPRPKDPLVDYSDKGRLLNQCMPEPNSGCWLWLGAAQQRGYGNFRLNAKTQRAHRASWIIFKGPIPAGKQVCHNCDTPLCVNPDHLWLGTNKDNQLDSIRKKRHGSYTKPHSQVRGEASPNAKLTASDITMIRNDPRPNKIIAKVYHVSPGVICNIRKRRAWAHID